ncbi:MAG: hypothetical protein ACREU8_05445 [Gammaproteobacteria bacterium]
MPANGKILRERAFERMWNAAGGGRYRRRDRRCPRRLSPAWPPGPRTPRTSGDAMRGSYLGPEYSQAEIEACLKSTGAVFEDDNALIEASGQALAEGKALGWHQGRMEFGPARSVPVLIESALIRYPNMLIPDAMRQIRSIVSGEEKFVANVRAEADAPSIEGGHRFLSHHASALFGTEAGARRVRHRWHPAPALRLSSAGKRADDLLRTDAGNTS